VRPESGPLGVTLLDKALREKREEAALLLLKHGSRYKNHHNFATFWFACINDSAKVAEFVLHECSNLNDFAPLHLAITFDKPLMLQMALQAGADPSAPPSQKVIHYLKANPDKILFGEEAPIHYAMKQGPQFVKALVDAGADLEARDKKGLTPLFLVLRPAHGLDSLRMFLEAGANPNAVDQDGQTPLHWAARKHFPKKAQLLLMKLLLAFGADPFAKDHRGRVPRDLTWRKAEHKLLSEAMAAHEASQAKGAGSGSDANSR
jgi:ankyrin repeat protein